MKPILSLAAFTVGAFGFSLILDPSFATAEPAKTKQELRKELRKKQKEAEAKATPAKAPETTTRVEPPKPAAKPPVAGKDSAAVARYIDVEISKRLAAAQVAASPRATDEEFLRRVYLDLTGRIPTAADARTFLDDKDPLKRAALVDKLLASPNYGKHFADIWQAKLFLKDSGNRFVLRDPFVEWLAAEFNANTPWNEFVTKIVTATGTVETNPAVTYFLSNRSVDKLIDGTTQHFLGIQLQCAQCHNHPFTTWKQTEYWGMAAFYSKVKADNPKNANKGGDNTQIGVQETNARSKAKDFFPESAKTVPAKFLGGPEPKLDDKEPNRPVLAKWMTAKENPFFARAMVNRTWATLFGSGFVNPVDDMHDDNPASHPELLDGLATQFAADGFDLKHLIKSICLSDAYQRSSKPTAGNSADSRLFSHMTMKVMSPEMLYDSLTQVVVAPAVDARKAKKPEDGKKPGNNARDTFVNFFLAGAEEASSTTFEAGIPQALRLMNSRFGGSAAAARAYAPPGARPADAIEKIYLATLSRRPTADELDRLTKYVGKSSNATDAYGDVLWAVLNSSEFSMIR